MMMMMMVVVVVGGLDRSPRAYSETILGTISLPAGAFRNVHTWEFEGFTPSLSVAQSATKPTRSKFI
jgi:hypothetical protein